MPNPITRRTFNTQLGSAAGALALGGCATAQKTAQTERQSSTPNIIVIFTDDQGWADIGVNGAEGFETPNLDRMAAEGVRFTDFYVAQPVCGASRCALLSGCYPNRVGILGAPGPGSRIGINSNEMLISELLKQKEYATAIFGKWHLGDHKNFLPLQHGFDEYYGLPYSNDMWPFHPETDRFPKLPLIEGNEIIEYNPDQSQLTRDYTFRAMKFIETNHQRPFFLYLAHSMPHVPLFVSDNFKGKSKRGLYGDVIMEIDWSVGRIMSSLRRFNLTENTLIVFASDNGPWVSYGDHAGSAEPLREAKGTTWDGGVRTPCLMRWPGTLPAGHVCDEPAMTIDILPTVAGITGTRLPNHPIDGRDIFSLMTNAPGAKSPHETLFFYWGKNLEAVRSENWSLHLPHAYRTLNGRPGGRNGMPVKYDQGRTELALFDLSQDVGQQRDVSKQNPEVLKRLVAYANQAKAELGHGDQPGSGQRPPGRRPNS